MSHAENIRLLNAAVSRHQQSPEMAKFLTRIMQVESSGRQYAANTESSAKGIFQFINSTWQQYGRGANVFDNAAQCDAVVRFAMDNGASLRQTLGREPDAGEYYLAHFAGCSGARKVLSADPATPIKSLLSADAMRSNASISFRGKKFADFTSGDLQAWADSRMDVDMDARQQYAQRRRDGTTTAREDAEELETRRRNLRGFGVDNDMLQQLGSGGILGDLFFAIIKFFMDASAPPQERDGQRQDLREASAERAAVQMAAGKTAQRG